MAADNMQASGKTVILQVDDDETLCEFMSVRLTRINYEVLTANSGKEALKILEDHKVDLAIIDVSMPGMSGYELLKHMKKKAPEVPVILLTGYRDDSNLHMSLEVGCNSFIEKPVTFETLAFTIDRVLQARKPGDIRQLKKAA